MKPLRVLMVGQKSLLRAATEKLLEETDYEESTGGFTRRRVGRIQIAGLWAPPGDKNLTWAATQGLNVLPELDPDLIKACGTDLIVCAHNTRYLDREVRHTPRLGVIGYHPSLLPRHRGIDAVTWTIKCGDPIAGGTVYRLDDGLDTGPILAQNWCHVDPRWSASDLWRERLFGMGVALLHRTVLDIHRGSIKLTPQDERFATEAPKWDNQEERAA